MSSALRDFVVAMTHLVSGAAGDEQIILDRGRSLLAGLVASSDWLSAEFAQAGADTYRQYLLHCDPLERFSVVSFVWGPGQSTPIHDHTVWGMIGMLRGREGAQRYTRDGSADRLAPAAQTYLRVGEIDLVSPRLGDIHRVWNDLADETSISIHVYGGNIGRISRHLYGDGEAAGRVFISGYSNDRLPNFWAA